MCIKPTKGRGAFITQRQWRHSRNCGTSHWPWPWPWPWRFVWVGTVLNTI